jgi:radical SAM superfamily enzyme YgiQ (UPF0313 family)
MKVLLVNVIDEKDAFARNMNPLGLCYLISYTKLHMDADFKMVNTGILNEVKNYEPDIIAITTVSQNYDKAIQFASDVKQKYDIPIIIGGIHISMLPETLSDNMDIGVVGEGEQTFMELLKCYEKYGNFDTGNIAHINGIVYKENNELVFTPPRELLNIDDIPVPYRDYKDNVVSMFSSRGCPYNCKFCSSTRFWGKVRFFSAKYVVNEMKELIDNGVKHISFSDDLFIADKERLREIVRLLPKSNTTINCACRANLIDDEVVDLLKKINCTTISMGLESGCDDTLKYLKGQSVTVDDNRNAIRIIKEHGITVDATFIIGAPRETREDILETLRFIKKNKIDNFWIYILTPLPGTPMWDFAVEHNLITSNFKWNNLRFDSGSITLSQTLNRRELHKLYMLFKKEQRRKLIRFTIKNVLSSQIKKTRRLL